MFSKAKLVHVFQRLVFPAEQRLYRGVSLPLPLLGFGVILAGLLFYVFGPNHYEDEFRMTMLFSAVIGMLIVLIAGLPTILARWLTVFASILLIFLLYRVWDNPSILNLLIFPLALTAILLNPFTVGLMTLLETTGLFFFYRLQLGMEQPWGDFVVTTAVIVLSGLIFAYSFHLLNQVLGIASADYQNLSVLLTESRAQQENLAQAMDDLAHANRQLSLLYDRNLALRRIAEEATDAKSNYIARVSHEIRTPLNMILGIADVVIENRDIYGDELPPELLDDIRIIRRNCDHLLSLVNDVLDLTRAEAGQLVLHKEWVDLGAEVEKSLEIVQPLARKKKLLLECVLHTDYREVYCDRTRIRQVILNLLSNAVRYTEKGSVSVNVAHQEAGLVIVVKDTGRGINPDDLERIFEPFYRGLNSSFNDTAGSGVGLSVSKQLVELHGGRIWVESQLGVGSSFYFQLPVDTPPVASRTAAQVYSENWMWVERKKRSGVTLSDNTKRIVAAGLDERYLSRIQDELESVELRGFRDVASMYRDLSETPAHVVIINHPDSKMLHDLLEEAVHKVKHTPIIGSNFDSPLTYLQDYRILEYLQKPFDINRLRYLVRACTPDNRTVMIIDDSREVQELVVRVLSILEGQTDWLVAMDGSQAIESLKKHTPDVILLDIALPEIDGWRVLKWIREQERLEKTPVLIISAYNPYEAQVQSPMVLFAHQNGVNLDELCELLPHVIKTSG